MSRQSQESKTDKENISYIIHEIANNPTLRSRELIQTIQGENVEKSFGEKRFHLDKKDTLHYVDNKFAYDKFCKAYLMYIFLVFIPEEHDAELMLFFYGFIKEFSGEDKQELYEKYWNHAHTYNVRLKRKRGDKGNLIRQVEKEIREKLSGLLEEQLSYKKVSTKLIDEVYKAFCAGDLPEQIPLPITDYFQRYHKTFQNIKQNLDETISSNSQNNDNRYRDPSESNTGYTENATKSKESSGDNEIGNSTSCIDDNTDTAPSKSGSFQDEESSHPEQPKYGSQLEAFEKLFRRFLILMAMRTLWGGIFVGCVLLQTYYYIQGNNTKETILTNIISEANKRPEIKSIEFKYKNFLLHPGQSTELEIEIDPPEINAKELKYSSSDESAVKTDKNIITACDILDEEHCEAIITATTQNRSTVEGKVYVMVREPYSYEEKIGYGANEEALDSIYTDFQSGE